jgi:hypothetical protein
MRTTAALLVSVLGVCLGAASPARAADPSPRLGAGAHTYEWVTNWLKLPAGMTIGSTHGDVVIDSRDRIYFSTDTGNGIVVTDTEGRIQRVFGQELGGGGHGLRLVREGASEVIWIAHPARHEAFKIALDGRVLQTLPAPDLPGIYKDVAEFKPTAVDVAPNGDVYVVDGYGRYWLHRYDAQGKLLQSWNGREGGAGAFVEPHGVGIDARGSEPRVVVADRRNHRLQIFTLDGKYVGVVTADLRLPSKVVTKGKDMVVVDLQGRVTIFDTEYKAIAQLGDNSVPELRGTFPVPPSKWKVGEFISPHGAAWDSKGNLYVQDWNQWGRVTKLRRVNAKSVPAAATTASR